MHFLLVHSPLIPPSTLLPLANSLVAADYPASIVRLTNTPPAGRAFYEHHTEQIAVALSELGDTEVCAVGHSGAGNLLARVNPSRVTAYAFLDAIFPLQQASRFDLFDSPAAVRAWKRIAQAHNAWLPRATLAAFAEQIQGSVARKRFVSELKDVPVALYEEATPVRSDWPGNQPGLFLQWTPAYSADAERAADSGFDVERSTATPWEMLNHPQRIAQRLIEFVAEV